MRITEYKDLDGLWRWRMRAKNGRTIADSAEAYKRKATMHKGLLKMLHAISDGFYDIQVVDE